jgi:hypothetical protein
MTVLAVVFAFLGVIAPAQAIAAEPAAKPTESSAPAEPDVLATLRRSHPRLLVLDDQFARLRQQVKTDPTAKAWFQKLQAIADKELSAPVAQRVLIGPRLLSVSRQVLGRTTLWAGMYRLTGDQKYADRCRQEMLAVAKFSDWHPPHFLDVAEMTNAVAIGYDWIYGTLSSEDRSTIEQAIIKKGLEPGLKIYHSKRGWHTNTNNWNQVCNGGLTAGALAIADRDPDIARQIIQNARQSIAVAMKQFAPDGGFIEGPGYWQYANEYTVYYLAALQTALGTDFRYLKTPGLADTGMFRIDSIGPLDRTFNFADAHDGTSPAPEMFWYARVFDRPVYAAAERALALRSGEVLPFDLWWFNSSGSEKDITKLPRAAMYKRVQVAFMRSSWNDRNAAYIGFKGGNNSASHAHLDLGTFVYDVDGARWAEDLGPDDYNLPGYFGHQRFEYYRLRTEGHNTLTIDGQNQPTQATAALTGFSADPDNMFAIADLSQGYPQAKQVRRGVRLIGRRLLVQDELQSTGASKVVWNLHTPAKIQIQSDPAEAVLSQSGKKLTLHILEPADARFDVVQSDIPPTRRSSVPRPQDKNRKPGQKLIIRLPEKSGDLRLVVLFSPQTETGKSAQLKIRPLSDWH